MKAYLLWSLQQLYLLVFCLTRFAREIEGDEPDQPHLRFGERLRYLGKMLPWIVMFATLGNIVTGQIYDTLGVAYKWGPSWFGVVAGVVVGVAVGSAGGIAGGMTVGVAFSAAFGGVAGCSGGMLGGMLGGAVGGAVGGVRNVEEGVIVSMALDRVIRSSLVGAISVQIVMTISAMVGGGGCGSWRSGWRGGWRGVWRGGWHEIFPTIDIPLRCCPNEYSLLDIIFEISCHHTGDLAMVPGIVE